MDCPRRRHDTPDRSFFCTFAQSPSPDPHSVPSRTAVRGDGVPLLCRIWHRSVVRPLFPRTLSIVLLRVFRAQRVRRRWWRSTVLVPRRRYLRQIFRAGWLMRLKVNGPAGGGGVARGGGVQQHPDLNGQLPSKTLFPSPSCGRSEMHKPTETLFLCDLLIHKAGGWREDLRMSHISSCCGVVREGLVVRGGGGRGSHMFSE